MTDQRIRINGELFTVSRIFENGHLPEIETEEGESFILAAHGACDKDEHPTLNPHCAGCQAENYWREMAQHDPAEFRCILGDENLVALALGQGAAPGSVHVQTLEEWFLLNRTVPEEQWASYDHDERTVERVGTLSDNLGFTPTVAYRSN